MKKILLNSLFPTTIGSYNDEDFVEKLIPYAKKYLNDPSELTYTWNYKNTYKLSNGVETKNEMQFLCDYLKKIGNLYLQENGFKKIDLKPQIFFSEMFEGDFHEKHFHQNSILSGVSYLNTPAGSSEIKFYDPRIIKSFYRLEIDKDNELNWEWVKIKPKKGLLLIFPSWLEHEVLKNSSKEGRMTMVFNLYK